MNPTILHDQAVWAALATAALAAFGERLHAARVARIGALAFGPASRPRRWTLLAPWLRVAALAGIVWSLITLISYDNLLRDRDRGNHTTRHLMVLLDVSPSMLIADGGDGQSTRMSRASAVLKSVLDRIPGDHVRFSAAGFYTDARMMVKECRDRELMLHLAGGIPFHVTYRPGKSDLLKSLNQTAGFMKDWPRKSTTLLVISDGGSVPPSGLEPMPSAVAQVVFAGVGDPGRGTFIDGHLSRQDSAGLSQLARRLGGKYFDCHTRHLPNDALRQLNAEDSATARWRGDRRVIALIVLASSSALLCLMPLLLEYLGSGWRPSNNPNNR